MGSAPQHSLLERLGDEQAAKDPAEDQRQIGGAKADFGEEGIGGGALADGGGEFAAIIDQLVDQVQQTAARGGLGDRSLGCGRCGHERNKNMSCGRVSRKIFSSSAMMAAAPRCIRVHLRDLRLKITCTGSRVTGLTSTSPTAQSTKRCT
jgi:hypothetical protein